MNWRSLYSGRALAASAPWPRGAAARFGSRPLFQARTYSRYPRYPQAESAWPPGFFVTASGCGRDDLSETKESLPSHSRSGCPAGRLRAAGRTEAKGRAADEAAARRTMAGLPFSGCESGRLREAPNGTESLRARGTGRRDTGPSGSGPARRKAGFRSARRHRRKRASARICRAGPGFGPGAANGRPRISVHGLPGGTEASAEDPAGCGTGGLGFRNREGGKRNASSKSAKRRTARASALVGEPAGKPGNGFGRGWTPEEAAKEPPAPMPNSRSRPARNASPPRLGSTRRDSGGRRQRRPPLYFNGFAARLIRRVEERPSDVLSAAGPASRHAA